MLRILFRVVIANIVTVMQKKATDLQAIHWIILKLLNGAKSTIADNNENDFPLTNYPDQNFCLFLEICPVSLKKVNLWPLHPPFLPRGRLLGTALLQACLCQALGLVEQDQLISNLLNGY